MAKGQYTFAAYIVLLGLSLRTSWAFAPFRTIHAPPTFHVSTCTLGTSSCHHTTRFNHEPSSRIRFSRITRRPGGILSAKTTSSEGLTRQLPQLISAAALFLLDIFFRRLFRLLNLTFPSSLAGCGVLFAFLLSVKQEKANTLFNQLQPGAALLAKWLPVFFVPTLITLPLSAGLGSFVELVKVGLVVVGGFLFTLLTTALSVVVVRKVVPNKHSLASDLSKPVESISFLPDEKQTIESSVPISGSQIAVTKGPFTNEMFYSLTTLSAVSGLAAIGAYFTLSVSQYTQPLTSLCLLLTTLSSYVYGTRLPKKFTKFVHPLLTCASLTWTVLGAFSLIFSRSFKSMLRSYRKGNVASFSAGDLLLFCLGPAVVSLAISMYERRKLMRDNLPEVGAAIATSTIGGVFGTAALVRVLEIGDPTLRLALLSRNITSPLAMAIAGILGADASLAVSMVVVTGLIGANFGASILSSLGIKDAVARGLGIGAAAHGLGTAAFVDEKDAFPFAAIAMALTASAATVTVSIPVFRRIILELALGY